MGKELLVRIFELGLYYDYNRVIDLYNCNIDLGMAGGWRRACNPRRAACNPRHRHRIAIVRTGIATAHDSQSEAYTWDTDTVPTVLYDSESQEFMHARKMRS